MELKIVYQLDRKVEQQPLKLRLVTRALLKKVRPLFEALDDVPAVSAAFEIEFVKLLKDRPELLTVVQKLQKSGDLTKLPDEERSAVAEVAVLRGEAAARARETIGTDEESLVIACKIMKEIVDTEEFETTFRKQFEGDVEKSEFWMSVDTQEVRKVVAHFREENAL